MVLFYPGNDKKGINDVRYYVVCVCVVVDVRGRQTNAKGSHGREQCPRDDLRVHFYYMYYEK